MVIIKQTNKQNIMVVKKIYSNYKGLGINTDTQFNVIANHSFTFTTHSSSYSTIHDSNYNFNSADRDSSDESAQSFFGSVLDKMFTYISRYIATYIFIISFPIVASLFLYLMLFILLVVIHVVFAFEDMEVYEPLKIKIDYILQYGQSEARDLNEFFARVIQWNISASDMTPEIDKYFTPEKRILFYETVVVPGNRVTLYSDLFWLSMKVLLMQIRFPFIPYSFQYICDLRDFVQHIMELYPDSFFTRQIHRIANDIEKRAEECSDLEHFCIYCMNIWGIPVEKLEDVLWRTDIHPEGKFMAYQYGMMFALYNIMQATIYVFFIEFTKIYVLLCVTHYSFVNTFIGKQIRKFFSLCKIILFELIKYFFLLIPILFFFYK